MTNKIEIIPAIDLIEGKCVRLTQGDYSQKKVYFDNPVDTARMFEENGLKRLHLVDLDGVQAKKIVNYRILEKIASKTKLIIDFGGGIKTDEDVDIAFNSGAAMITVGSIAVKDKELCLRWLEKYSAKKIILGADVKDEKVAISGWKEVSEIELLPFIETYMKSGINKVICTDIAKDGMMKGASNDLYKKILDKFSDLFLIASGGVTTIDDLEKLVEINVSGAIIGKAIYEGTIKLKDLQPYIN
jgi:phosphoribosylformimino-5-aminoimidazole carboxamide ribotide isomerase